MDARTLELYALGVVQAYLLGAVPFGYIIVKAVKGVDIRAVGSGNIGATNVARAAGKGWAVTAFALDVLKGLLATTLIPFAFYVIARGFYRAEGPLDLLGAVMSGGNVTVLRMLCGLAAIIGHSWTVFLKFRGGKGVATSLGVFLGLAPLPTLISFLVWAIIFLMTGYVSLGSIVAAIVLPASYGLLSLRSRNLEWMLLAFCTLVAALVIIRHRANIKRLREGTENRFHFGRKDENRAPKDAEGPPQAD